MHKEATTRSNATIELASPSPPGAVNGGYIFITETDEQWVPKELIEDLDANMEYLHKQLEDETIRYWQCLQLVVPLWQCAYIFISYFHILQFSC